MQQYKLNVMLHTFIHILSDFWLVENWYTISKYAIFPIYISLTLPCTQPKPFNWPAKVAE